MVVFSGTTLQYILWIICGLLVIEHFLSTLTEKVASFMKGRMFVHVACPFRALLTNVRRWSDVTVQTIMAGLFLKKEELHFFNEIGFEYWQATHCPLQPEYRQQCICSPEQTTGKLPLYCYIKSLHVANTQFTGRCPLLHSILSIHDQLLN